jgi:hypothetical protein
MTRTRVLDRTYEYDQDMVAAIISAVRDDAELSPEAAIPVLMTAVGLLSEGTADSEQAMNEACALLEIDRESEEMEELREFIG